MSSTHVQLSEVVKREIGQVGAFDIRAAKLITEFVYSISS